VDALGRSIQTYAASSRGELERPDLIALFAASGAVLAVWWLCAVHPAMLPFWAPWEFSWTQFLASVLSLWWYLRGVALSAANERPAVWRQAAFVIGLGTIYIVLLTRFEYMAQHMFFLNRLQHMIMHHVGPFLIATSWPGAPLLRGMPAPLRHLLKTRPVGAVMHVIQQPVLAGALFAGLIVLWLQPQIHFRAMIDPELYSLMNWSMVLDGLLFWCLVLDPRPPPQARTSFGVRLLLTLLVMFPQIAAGSAISLSSRSLYPYYDLCGRLYPSIGALLDQHIGGIIVWIPSSMMSSLAFMLILNNLRLYEDKLTAKAKGVEDIYVGGVWVSSSRWTGR
jgi:putative membrane protein